MIDTKLIDILPKNISDEAAYHMVNFIAELSIAIENHYLALLKRYVQDRDQTNWI